MGEIEYFQNFKNFNTIKVTLGGKWNMINEVNGYLLKTYKQNIIYMFCFKKHKIISFDFNPSPRDHNRTRTTLILFKR